jgi:glyoxylase-like metal-dependent hydrolase (beta-lactamase superfamily II)
MKKLLDDLWLLSGHPRYTFNVYMIGNVLIDAATRWATPRILRQLEKRPPEMVALTHCHPDHQGAAHAVCKRYDVPLACHEGDVPATEGREAMWPHNWIIRLGTHVWGGRAYPVGRVLHDGDTVNGFRVIHTPGHTPGHVMYYRSDDRVAIAGDVLANLNVRTRKSGLRFPPRAFCKDWEQNRRAVLKLWQLQPSVICFGHGPPLYDLGVLERFVRRWY